MPPQLEHVVDLLSLDFELSLLDEAVDRGARP